MRKDEASSDTYTNRTRRAARLAPYTRFLLRWGWFIVLSIALATVVTWLLPDSASPPAYQATLGIQVSLPPGMASATNINTSTTFYSDLFMSPGTLSLVLPKYKDLQLSDLEALVVATPVTDTNFIDLSASGSTPKDAMKLAIDVYNAAVTEVHTHRSMVVTRLTASLNTEIKQCQDDAANSQAQLQTLTIEHLTDSSLYLQINSLYQQQLQCVANINKELLQLQQQGFGSNDILRLSKPTPDITTISSSPPTQGLRLALSPLIGAIMGLGGILLASTFSNRLPSRGKKRELLLPWVIATIPLLPRSRDNRVQVIKQTSPCLPLWRHLRYQTSEHERPLNLITVTSPRGHEGKSTIAIGLAIAAAQSGLRTLLVDGNPQRPILHSWFHVSNAQGTLDASRLLNTGPQTPSPIIRTSELNLGLIPIGNKQPTTDELAELLQIDMLRPFTEVLRRQADIVIIDGPSLLSDANATNLVQLSDMALLVIDAQKSQSTAVVEAENLLSTIGISSAIVLNRANPESME
ncbi:MAG: AAA family ATPase [Chloroflexota bacterium]|nr:AAA family ATPase [Chloroflexota bacterium]